VNSALPAVSVSIITYNQRELIGRAIDSVLMQEVDFSYEIVIGDDCSDDGTQEAIEAYRRRHPDKVQLILHPRRYTDEVPGRTNNTTNLLNCRGKYIAMLDGDDYWTDPGKLQRQYDRMEAQPELSMCLHDARMAYDTEPTQPGYVSLMSEEVGGSATGYYTHEDLARRDRLHPFIGSVMFRTAYLRELPDWFYEIVAADYALLLHLSQRGGIYYDARPSADYYVSPRGFQRVFRKNPNILLQELKDIDTYALHFPATRLNGKLTRGKATLHWHLYQYYREGADTRAALRHLSGMFLSDPRFGLSMTLNPARKLRNYCYTLVSKRAIRSAENSATMRS
jgi:glycosyltransferase involved in cell wall biosynthesis